MKNGAVVDGAGYHRGASRGDIATPREFVTAVERRYYGRFDFDLAADAHNTVAPSWYDIQQDALRRDWQDLRGKTCWCNPPYSDIGPWVRKAAESVQSLQHPRIVMLLPAAIGSRWYADWVYPYAVTVVLRPRIVFRGHSHPYPRGLILAVYDGRRRHLELWDWVNEVYVIEWLKKRAEL